MSASVIGSARNRSRGICPFRARKDPADSDRTRRLRPSPDSGTPPDACRRACRAPRACGVRAVRRARRAAARRACEASIGRPLDAAATAADTAVAATTRTRQAVASGARATPGPVHRVVGGRDPATPAIRQPPRRPAEPHAVATSARSPGSHAPSLLGGRDWGVATGGVPGAPAAPGPAKDSAWRPGDHSREHHDLCHRTTILFVAS